MGGTVRDRIGSAVNRMTALLVAVVCSGCASRNPTFSNGQIPTPGVPGRDVAIYECTASVSNSSIRCEPPAYTPEWAFHPDSSARCVPIQTGPCNRRLVRVLFQPGATADQRQAAVTAVGGIVVGGSQQLGYYYVRIGGDGTLTTLNAAIQSLRALSQVQRAVPFETTPLSPDGRAPTDGGNWQRWQFRPLDADGNNWSREQVGAPFGWGCSIGDSTTTVAVIDRGFHPVSDIARNVDRANSHGYNVGYPSTTEHGTQVATILAGRGNDSTQATGMMWHARLRLYDYSVQVVHTPTGAQMVTGAGSLSDLWDHLGRAGRSGARVINISVGVDWASLRGLPAGSTYNPATETDTSWIRRNAATRHGWLNDFNSAMDSITAAGHHPLVVFSAGNASIPAEWNIARMAVDSSAAHGPRVIVVGGNNINRQFASFSNTGGVISVVAPAVGVHTIGAGGGEDVVDGTSFAAPHVAGIGGMLASFDPRLTGTQLKEFIVEGAVRGGLTAGGFPIANAYGSLRRAAERRGAPLCGNPVYQDSLGRVIARRESLWYNQADNDTTNNEVLFTSMADSLPTVLHGGKRIRFSNSNGREWRLVSGTPSWQILTGVLDALPNATSRSKQGRPHGSAFPGQVDTVVTVSKAYIGSSGTQRTERLTVRINGSPFRDVDVVVPKRQNSPVEYSGCASWYVSDPSITSCLENATPFIYAWRDSVATTASVAMYPTGDTIVLAVAQDSFAFNIGAPQGHGNTWERPYGDYSNTVSTTLYFIPVQGGRFARRRYHGGWRLSGFPKMGCTWLRKCGTASGTSTRPRLSGSQRSGTTSVQPNTSADPGPSASAVRFSEGVHGPAPYRVFRAASSLRESVPFSA